MFSNYNVSTSYRRYGMQYTHYTIVQIINLFSTRASRSISLKVVVVVVVVVVVIVVVLLLLLLLLLLVVTLCKK